MNRSSARRPRSGLHCREAVARSSRSPIGDCYDCAMCESFVRDLKRPGFARCGHLRGRVSQAPWKDGRGRPELRCRAGTAVTINRPPIGAASSQFKKAALRRPLDPAQYLSIRYTERLAEAGIEPSVEASVIPTTMPWRKRSSASTRPRSSAAAAPGEPRRGRVCHARMGRLVQQSASVRTARKHSAAEFEALYDGTSRESGYGGQTQLNESPENPGRFMDRLIERFENPSVMWIAIHGVEARLRDGVHQRVGQNLRRARR